MRDVVRTDSEFEGIPFTTYGFHGRLCWVAQEVGRLIGHCVRGKQLPALVLGEWGSHFIPGYDYTLLVEDDLELFVGDVQDPGAGAVSSRTHRSLLLLFEPGLHTALARTSKPVACRLRRFLAEEILPMQTGTTRQLLAVCEHRTPRIETLESPEEIAQRLGISSRRVWRTIARLWLRRDLERVAYPTGIGPRRSDRAAYVFLYSAGDVERIEQELRERDVERSERA